MTEAIIFAIVAVVLLLVLLWLVREPRVVTPTAAEGKLRLEGLFQLHCRHFPQVRQVLSRADEEYMRRRASSGLRRQWQRERRNVARQYLAGLRADFSRLNRLARLVAALAPEVRQTQEAELLWLGLRFRILYVLVSLRLETGFLSVPELGRLADLVGGLAAQIDTGIATLSENSLLRLRADFNA